MRERPVRKTKPGKPGLGGSSGRNKFDGVRRSPLGSSKASASSGSRHTVLALGMAGHSEAFYGDGQTALEPLPTMGETQRLLGSISRRTVLRELDAGELPTSDNNLVLVDAESDHGIERRGVRRGDHERRTAPRQERRRQSDRFSDGSEAGGAQRLS